MSSTLLYIDIAAVTALFSTDLIDISHAEDGEPGTGTIRGIFPEGAFWQDSIDLLTDEAATLGISITSEDSDGATVILCLDWRNGISRERAEKIIEEEGMNWHNVGHSCVVISDDGTLTDGDAREAADLSSGSAFRAQVVAWRQACGLDRYAGKVAYFAEARPQELNGVEYVAANVGWGDDTETVSVRLMNDGSLDSHGILDWSAITDDDGAEFAEWLAAAQIGDTFRWHASA